jgi:polyisoprenoid-binding protein YceI
MRPTRATAWRAALLTALLAASAAAVPAPGPVFDGYPKDKACVAWKARKRLWMFWHEDAAGVSCSVKVRAVAETGGRSVRVSFQIASLRSGESLRDYRVQECLGADRVRDIVFVSRAYRPDEWTALRAGRLGALEGRLKISGVPYRLRLPFTVSGSGAGAAAEGAVMTSLAGFGIPAPIAKSAFFMRVDDAVELDYRVPLSDL